MSIMQCQYKECGKSFSAPKWKHQRFCTKTCANKNRKGEKRGCKFNVGENNPMWKGDNVGLKALHEWVRNKKPRPKFCVECNTSAPIDLANISQEYKRDTDDFEWLCRRCHMNKDGRIHNLRNN